jgi:hypothetical protein
MMKQKVFGNSFEVLVSACAFAGFEVVAIGQVDDATQNSFLDKIASRIVLPDDTLESGKYPVVIRDRMTTVLIFSLLLKCRQKGDEVGKSRAARDIKEWLRHGFFRKIVASVSMVFLGNLWGFSRKNELEQPGEKRVLCDHAATQYS